MNWYKKASRTIKEHIHDVVNAHIEIPIFVTKDNEIIDGAHRTCKAYLLGKKIQAIHLSQDDINPALLSKDSDYVGQIYRDDDKNEYSITKLTELYGKRKPVIMDPKIILRKSKNVWGKKVDIYYILEEAQKELEK